MRRIAVSTATTTTAPPMAAVEMSTLPPAVAQPRSPWHSPVPYLFGGLAAMLGLIAFALLILACSYWRLSAAGRSEDERDLESQKEGGNDSEKPEKVYEEKFLVIMAGNEKPTFLATPVANNKGSCLKNDRVEKREGDSAESEAKVVVKEEITGADIATTANYNPAEVEHQTGAYTNEDQETQQAHH